MNWQSDVSGFLVRDKVLTQERLDAATSESARTGVPVHDILLKRGHVTEKTLGTAVAEACGVPFVDLATYQPDPEVKNTIPERTAREFGLLPLFRIDGTLTVAMRDPTDLMALDAARGRSGLLIDPVVGAPTAIRNALERLHAPGATPEPAPERREAQRPEPLPQAAVPSEPAGADQIVSEIVEQAMKDGASDIHVEPTEDALDVRFRVDGVLRKARGLPSSAHASIVSRIKILSNMDIAESRLPQDGRFRQELADRSVDVRVSCIPTVHGENVVMRLLDTRMMEVGLPQMGMTPAMQAQFERMARTPYGILLVTGPTGSGKTTTLYATLSLLNTPDRHIITIEDPVEYRLVGIRQIQVNDKVGLKFTNGLRSILRQDPDIIMVGEIRDKETAEIAIQSALTGHFVLSTLHTNDAATALARLTDMGVEPFLVCSSIVGVVAQRLVRKVCQDCKEPYTLTGEEAVALGLPEDQPRQFFRGRGCLSCKSSGFRGRTALYELMEMSQALRALVASNRTADEIRQAAQGEGMRTLSQDGFDKARRGITTIEEVVRVTKFA